MENFDESWSPYVKALYWDSRGDWDKAHGYVDQMTTTEAAWVHAYLHRKEGDEANAGYWYRRAGKDFFRGSLEEEWEELWQYFKNKKFP